jgi:hypothetical protein
LEHKKLHRLDDFFLDLNQRQEKGIYFCRLNGYSGEIKNFIQKYYEEARRTGVVIEGKIPNPDEKNLAYYEEIMGMSFQMSMGFLTSSLKKWLPRMNDYQRNTVAASIYDTLDEMRKTGKNDNMLKNAYIKFMCWLYYRFERVVSQLGENKVPKILYEGNISNYELKLIVVLAGAGCDVVLLQYQGDAEYRKLDAQSVYSDNYESSDQQPFPQNFSLKAMREEQQEQKNRERLYGQLPTVTNCTNAWITGKGFRDITTAVSGRGTDTKLFYNCFCRMEGVEDKLTYSNELYQLQLELKSAKRKVVIAEGKIPNPDTEEISKIVRSNYQNFEQMIASLSRNINHVADSELQKIINKSFIDILAEESKTAGMNINKLTNKAVYLLCWLKRYQPQLFSGWKFPEIACFIYLGGCKNENEVLFMKFLARLPVDVLILVPNLNEKCCLSDPLLYEIHYTTSLNMEHYPQENAELSMGTAAYHAERELDALMYQDSGIYRNQQYQKAVSVTLRTMYEEISILWDEELKYRPNFSVVDSVVNIPVIFAKISGVKDRQIDHYWTNVRNLITQDTIVIKNPPYIQGTDNNPMKAYATQFFKNGRLQREKIKNHPDYQYGYLRSELQEHMLDKLQQMIEQKIIRGTFENGTEYTIIATALNLNKELLRLLQKFDFTKKNPKIIYINTTERMISLEDSIAMAYLNLVGFDILFFVPTGYQSVEKYFQKNVMEEHQIGEYVYDLAIPDLSSSNIRQTWRQKIFKRGN